MTQQHHTDECAHLEALWHREFPIAQAMQVRVEAFDAHALTTRAPLSPNTNIHGTAFAGSLYALEALTAWGLIYLECHALNLDASIIHAHGTINFATTIEEDIVAYCQDARMPEYMETLQSAGKVRFDLTTQVLVNGKLASDFTGNYAVRLAR